MPETRPTFPLRLDPKIRAKIEYIADDSFRTLTGELTMLILKRIEEYEKEHGPIEFPEE
ncbi:MAG: hypothetical protein LBS72_07455 [Oscillospiraceae bacterium]|nr:hypothetical protein [Oscillospiraceae bacterium]